MNNQKTSQKGFTLLEIMIVVTIIGILSTLIMIYVRGAQEKARDGKRSSDVISIRTALVEYYSDNGEYPIYAGYHDSSTDPFLSEIVASGHFSATPKDPLNEMKNGTNYYYTYRSTNSGQDFVLDAVMEEESLCGPRFFSLQPGGETAFVVYSEKETFDDCLNGVDGSCNRWQGATPIPCTP